MKLIQVAYDISSPTTYKREIKALAKAGEKLKCSNQVLLSLYADKPSDIEEDKNIKVLDVLSWLIQPVSDFSD